MPLPRLLLLGLLLTAGIALIPGPSTAAALDYDCADFANQAEAQSYLLAGDPYRLDGDDDGRACEELPCPCSYSAAAPPSDPYTPPAPAPAPAPTSPPVEEPASLTAYVACGLSRFAPRARECSHRSKVGAFFRSSRELTYTLCITFPGGRRLCAYDQVAQPGVLYVNKVTTSSVGRHKVVWFADGNKITRYFWRR